MKIATWLFELMLHIGCAIAVILWLMVVAEKCNAEPLSGTNMGVNKTSADVNDFINFGGKLVRWQLVYGGNVTTNFDYAAYRNWIGVAMNDLTSDTTVPFKVVLLLSTPGPVKYSNKLWRARFYETWEDIARTLKGNKYIYGYDLINEPNLRNSDLKKLYKETIKRILRIDPQANIILSSKLGSPKYLSTMKPISGANSYTVHLWQPLSYTHQGVMANFKYPKALDYQPLLKDISYIRKFQKKNPSKKIFIGEFGCARWAPNCKDFLWTIIQYCKTFNWVWTFHAYRDFQGWDQEYSSVLNNGIDSGEVRTVTDRFQVILDGWK